MIISDHVESCKDNVYNDSVNFNLCCQFSILSERGDRRDQDNTNGGIWRRAGQGRDGIKLVMTFQYPLHTPSTLSQSRNFHIWAKHRYMRMAGCWMDAYIKRESNQNSTAGLISSFLIPQWLGERHYWPYSKRRTRQYFVLSHFHFTLSCPIFSHPIAPCQKSRGWTNTILE